MIPTKRIVLLLAVMMLPRFAIGVNVPGQGIKCVEWIGIDPGDGQTNLEGTTLNGGGKRIFPDKNTPGANGKTHDKVKVKVTVVPDNAPVELQVFDVDDPTDHDGPIDSDPAGPDLTNPPDNKGGVKKLKVLTGGGGQEGVTVSGNAQNGIFEAELTVSFEPGDNYRVVAACPGFLQGLKAKKSDNNAQVIDANNTLVPETCDALAARKSSPLLSVWRKLHVEVDSMGAEPAGQQFDADDLLRGDVPDPDIGAFPNAFAPAYITVAQDTGKDNGNTAWVYSFANPQALANYCLGATGQRGTQTEENEWWSAYVLGIYEVNPGFDNDHRLGAGSHRSDRRR